MSKGNRGRVITGPDDPENKEPELVIPPLNQYWIIWFNPETEKIERVSLNAHTVEIHEDGMLVFKAYVKNDDPAMPASEAPPIFGYYVSSFRNHFRFGQEQPGDGKVH